MRVLTFQQTSGRANAPRTTNHKENTNSSLFPFPFPDVTTTNQNINSRKLSLQQLATAPSEPSKNQASVVATTQWHSESCKKNENANPNVTATNWNVNARAHLPTDKWVVVFIPSNLVGRKDFFRESFRDASAVQNVPSAREVCSLELPRMLPRRFRRAKRSFRERNCQLSFRECFRELLRVGREAHFSFLMSNSLFVLTSPKKNRRSSGRKVTMHTSKTSVFHEIFAKTENEAFQNERFPRDFSKNWPWTLSERAFSTRLLKKWRTLPAYRARKKYKTGMNMSHLHAQPSQRMPEPQLYPHSAPSTRTMSTEGCAGTVKNATLPAAGAFDTHDLRHARSPRRVAHGHSETQLYLHSARLRRARSPQRVASRLTPLVPTPPYRINERHVKVICMTTSTCANSRAS